MTHYAANAMHVALRNSDPAHDRNGSSASFLRARRHVSLPLNCDSLKANAVRLQLHALAHNLANFLRTLALPPEVAKWSMTRLRDRLVKIGARIVRHGRSLRPPFVSRAAFYKDCEPPPCLGLRCFLLLSKYMLAGTPTLLAAAQS
jgi:Transposase DDE domain group 1